MITYREQLRTAALLGSTAALQPEGSPLDPWVQAMANRNLDALALVTSYEAIAALPLPAPSLPAASMPDDRAECGAVAAGHLVELLNQPRALLPEWLGLLNGENLRPPAELLPALLDVASTNTFLRQAANIAAGPIGTWLAPYRPEWAWLLTARIDEAVWETGSFAERLALLRELRLRTPARALELAQTTWQTESADQRRLILEVCSAGLSEEDEDFLEIALDDRSLTVRRAAADLLASLPGSRLGQRMTERLSGRIELKRTGLLGRGRSLDLSPLETLDPQMLRDGIEKKPPAGLKLGERAWWTCQAIASIPPSYWAEALKSNPAELIQAAKESEWADTFMEGWRTAAIRHRATDWLLEFAAVATPGLNASAAIFAALTPQNREQAIAQLLKRDARFWLQQLPEYCNHPWSSKFTESILEEFDRNLMKDPTDSFNYQIKPLLKASALLASPSIRSIPEGEMFAEFSDILRFRQRMREALLTPNAHNQENR